MAADEFAQLLRSLCNLSNLCQTKNPHEQNIKMPLQPPKNRTAYGTYQYLTEPGVLGTFLWDYQRTLTENFHTVKIEGDMEYWN